MYVAITCSRGFLVMGHARAIMWCVRRFESKPFCRHVGKSSPSCRIWAANYCAFKAGSAGRRQTHISRSLGDLANDWPSQTNISTTKDENRTLLYTQNSMQYTLCKGLESNQLHVQMKVKQSFEKKKKITNDQYRIKARKTSGLTSHNRHSWLMIKLPVD
jgi:hypothetical protein